MSHSPYKLVVIEWIDSYGCSSDWSSLDITQQSMKCQSVGWLVHDGDDCKTIVPHICQQESQGCGDMTIPTEAIKSIVVLQDPDGRDGKETT